MPKYGLQHGHMDQTENQVIKCPYITSVKQFKQKNGLMYIKKEKRETPKNHINKRQQ